MKQELRYIYSLEPLILSISIVKYREYPLVYFRGHVLQHYYLDKAYREIIIAVLY